MTIIHETFFMRARRGDAFKCRVRDEVGDLVIDHDAGLAADLSELDLPANTFPEGTSSTSPASSYMCWSVSKIGARVN
jgi:hypothetical protein